MGAVRPHDDEIRALLEGARTIAVVGASRHEAKPAHRIPRYLQARGYRIIPVNPYASEILGEPARPSLLDVTEPVDLVDVFRPSTEAPAIARAAVEIGARALWLQSGIVSEEAAGIAEGAGMLVVMDSCLEVAHRLHLAGRR